MEPRGPMHHPDRRRLQTLGCPSACRHAIPLNRGVSGASAGCSPSTGGSRKRGEGQRDQSSGLVARPAAVFAPPGAPSIAPVVAGLALTNLGFHHRPNLPSQAQGQAGPASQDRSCALVGSGVTHGDGDGGGTGRGCMPQQLKIRLPGRWVGPVGG